jgi:hypothetical protein
MKINLVKRSGEWRILKNGKKIDAETSKVKAQKAVKFYRGYFNVPKAQRKQWIRNTY